MKFRNIGNLDQIKGKPTDKVLFNFPILFGEKIKTVEDLKKVNMISIHINRNEVNEYVQRMLCMMEDLSHEYLLRRSNLN